MRISPYIKIKKRSQPLWLIWFIIIYPFSFGFLNELIGLPNAIKYLMDIAWITLIVLAFMNINRNRVFIEKGTGFIYIYLAVFLLLTFVVYLFNFQSPLYYLWGLRNNFRFYIVFLAFVLFLRREDVYDSLRLFDGFFWVNSVVCIFQYAVMGIKQDYLGGLFGTEIGGNGYLNIFFVVVITKSIILYLNKKESLWLMLSKCAVTLLIVALAEIKFFYIEFVFILIVAVLISDFTPRKVVLILSGIIGMVLSIGLLQLIFPYFFGFFDIEEMILSATKGGYSGAKQVNRLTTVPIISEKFLDTPLKKLFGLGLGNCDTSAYEFLTTPFYTQYSYMRYQWFSTAYLYLETGFVGMSLYFGFFILIFFYSIKQKKYLSGDKQGVMLCQISATLSVIASLITVYNSSLRTEASYILFFALSFAFVAGKEKIINE